MYSKIKFISLYKSSAENLYILIQYGKIKVSTFYTVILDLFTDLNKLKFYIGSKIKLTMRGFAIFLYHKDLSIVYAICRLTCCTVLG